MIFYNMRYRGAYEYDKFSLNILQFNNMMNEFEIELEEQYEYKNLKQLQAEITNLYEEYTGMNGVSERLYNQLVLFSEVKR